MRDHQGAIQEIITKRDSKGAKALAKREHNRRLIELRNEAKELGITIDDYIRITGTKI